MRTKGFLGIECILYILFILLDCFFPSMGKASMDLKYMGIVLCFFYVICLLPSNTEQEDTVVVRTAMFFTLIADTFLIKLDIPELGVACFIMVQVCYFYRLHKHHISTIVWNCILFFIVYFAVDFLVEEIPLLVVLGEFYIVMLFRNVWDSFFHSKNRFFQFGLVLFLLCDLSVGVFNLPQFIRMPEWYLQMVYPVVAVLIWVFYLPSQVLLCLSIEKQ